MCEQTDPIEEAARLLNTAKNQPPVVSVFRRSSNEDDRRMDEQWMDVRKTVEESHAGFVGSGLGDFGWPARNFDTELPGVLRVEPGPTELHRLACNDVADGSSAEKVIQNIETNV